MKDIFAVIGGLTALLVLTLLANHFAQKLLPTYMSDPFGRRWGYTIVTRLIFIAMLIAGLAMLAGLGLIR